MFYTTYYNWDNPIKALETTGPIGILIPVILCVLFFAFITIQLNSFHCFIQCLLVYWNIISTPRLEKLKSLTLFAGDKIYEIEHPEQSVKYVAMCEKSVIRLWLTTFKTFLCISLGMLCYVAMPIYSLLFKNMRPLFLPVLIPFVNVNTTTGYFINMTYQILFSLLGLTGIYAIESITCILKNNVWVASESIKYSIEELTASMGNGSAFTYESKMRLRNILMKIRDFDEFIIKFCDLFYWKFLLQPILATYAVSVSLFIYFHVSVVNLVW